MNQDTRRKRKNIFWYFSPIQTVTLCTLYHHISSYFSFFFMFFLLLFFLFQFSIFLPRVTNHPSLSTDGLSSHRRTIFFGDMIFCLPRSFPSCSVVCYELERMTFISTQIRPERANFLTLKSLHLPDNIFVDYCAHVVQFKCLLT